MGTCKTGFGGTNPVVAVATAGRRTGAGRDGVAGVGSGGDVGSGAWICACTGLGAGAGAGSGGGAGVAAGVAARTGAAGGAGAGSGVATVNTSPDCTKVSA